MPELSGVPGETGHFRNFSDHDQQRTAFDRSIYLVAYYTAGTGLDSVPGFTGSITEPYLKEIIRVRTQPAAVTGVSIQTIPILARVSRWLRRSVRVFSGSLWAAAKNVTCSPILRISPTRVHMTATTGISHGSRAAAGAKR